MDFDVFDTSDEDSTDVEKETSRDSGEKTQTNPSPVKESISGLVKSEDGEEGTDSHLRCGSCRKTFSDWQVLEKHERSHKMDDIYLSYVLNERPTLGKSRVKRSDSHQRQFKCKTCGEVFKRLRDLRVHVDMHEYLEKESANMKMHEKIFSCKECSKTFQ